MLDSVPTGTVSLSFPATAIRAFPPGLPPTSCDPRWRTTPDLPPADDAAWLQPRVDGLALHRQDAEDALVHAVQRLAPDEAFERFDAEPELADRK